MSISYQNRDILEEMKGIELQRLAYEDLDQYLAFEKKVESRTYTAAQNAEEAKEEYEQDPMYFIRQGGEVVGTASYSMQEDGSAYINGLAIAPAFQGQGLGRAALELILQEIHAAPRVWLVTHPENEKAIALYESLGFVVTNRIENYHGDGEPRIVLTKSKKDGA